MIHCRPGTGTPELPVGGAAQQAGGMTGTFARGLIAGAAGTTALNAATYLDMALRGRDASTVPEQTVDALAGATGHAVPGTKAERGNRRTGLGALAGIANGLTVGLLASVARSTGMRLPALVGPVVTGAAALAATDGPVAALGVSDPRRWSTGDWVADAWPHLAYGAVAHAVVAGVPTDAERLQPVRPAPAGLVLRSALLGLATGARSSLGLAAPALTGVGTGAAKRLAAAASVAGELYLDKRPGTPARTGAAGLPARLAAGAGGAGVLARREAANTALPVAAAVAGAAASSVGGLAWRRWAADRMPDWQGALVEDGAALLLAALACLPGRRPAPRPVLTIAR